MDTLIDTYIYIYVYSVRFSYCCQFKSTRLIPIFLYMLCLCLVLDAGWTGAEIKRALGGLGANQRRKSLAVHKESCVTLYEILAVALTYPKAISFSSNFYSPFPVIMPHYFQYNNSFSTLISRLFLKVFISITTYSHSLLLPLHANFYDLEPFCLVTYIYWHSIYIYLLNYGQRFFVFVPFFFPSL